MSAEIQMSAAETSVDFPYRAVSRTAIASLVFAALATVGLIPTFAVMLSMALVGLLVALIGLRSTTRYPEEFGGKSIALFGLAVNGMLLIGGVGMHVYTYMTEVPEGYERVHFYKLQQPDETQPDLPPNLAMDLHGKNVFIKGYIHPASGMGMLGKFVMVPDLGTCCFGGQPRSTDMIEVTLTGGQKVKAGMMQKKLAGVFELNQRPRALTDFDNIVFYRLQADQVK
ncbi:MAG: DUF3299 domain-containing protein [Planctomycetota bacterium]